MGSDFNSQSKLEVPLAAADERHNVAADCIVVEIEQQFLRVVGATEQQVRPSVRVQIRELDPRAKLPWIGDVELRSVNHFRHERANFVQVDVITELRAAGSAGTANVTAITRPSASTTGPPESPGFAPADVRN